MATEITGGNNQVGTRNQQSITNNTFHMHFHLSHQHQHQEGVSLQGGDVRQVIDWLQTIAAPPSQTNEGAALQSENDPAALTQTEEGAALQSENDPAALTQTEEGAALQSENNPAPPTQTDEGATLQSENNPASPTQTDEGAALQSENDPAPPGESATVTDSVRILDHHDRLLEPGDIVWIGSVCSGALSIYVGDGYLVRYDGDSETVVKEKLNMTLPFEKRSIVSCGNLEVYSATQRVKRALQQVGNPSPVQIWDTVDFVYYLHTGLDYGQSCNRGFRGYYNYNTQTHPVNLEPSVLTEQTR